MAKRGQTSWTPLYMLIVIIIAAVLVMTLVKPAFRLASQQAATQEQQATDIARGAIFGLGIIYNQHRR